jgi:hypothetical protein
MGFQKFGTGDDQKIVADKNDTQGVKKTASTKLSEKDREELRKENQK